jgi:hypothetical protein
MSAFYGATDEDESTATIRRALELGMNLLDTADMYGASFGENEQLLGRAIAGRRDEVVLATKFGNALEADGAWRINGRPDYVREAIDGSLARLGVDYVLGAMRLSTGLLVGRLLSEVAGFVVSVNGREGEWSSSSPKREFALERDTIEIGAGDEIAVAISISQPIKDDVLAYIDEEQLPVASLHVYRPVAGASREAIPTPEYGAGAAARRPGRPPVEPDAEDTALRRPRCRRRLLPVVHRVAPTDAGWRHRCRTKHWGDSRGRRVVVIPIGVTPTDMAAG